MDTDGAECRRGTVWGKASEATKKGQKMVLRGQDLRIAQLGWWDRGAETEGPEQEEEKDGREARAQTPWMAAPRLG
jgi:hypothetical protein